ncbi:MAG TPA: endonuclease/exonuclease/phosphatase family protein, partial [Actinophytocola sp.]
MPRRALRTLGLVCALMGLFALPLTEPATAERTDAPPVIGPAHGDTLQVMSFNLRFASDRGPNSWPQRRPAMAQLLRREQPTVLGTQEGLYAQLRDIEDDLPGYYDWIGEGRGGGSRDEFMAIYYDSRRL